MDKREAVEGEGRVKYLAGKDTDVTRDEGLQDPFSFSRTVPTYCWRGCQEALACCSTGFWRICLLEGVKLGMFSQQ